MWILAGIVVLGLMVLVHEFGHFLVARLFAVRVDVFSIGFGPRLFGRRGGATDYRVSALPLGGYVKMAGDDPSGERAGAPDEFLSKPRWQRALIALAGPTTNIVMAVLLLTGLYTYRYERPAFLDQPAVIGAVTPDSPAAGAGLQPGDRIVRLGSLRAPTWEDVLVESALSGGSVPVEIERGGTRLTLELVLPENVQEEPWQVGWVPESQFVIRTVLPDTPAARAGFRAGDVVLAVNGEPLRILPGGENPLSAKLQQLGGQPVTLTIERDAVRQDVVVTPEYADHPDGGQRWVMGVELVGRTARKELGVVQAFWVSLEDNWQSSGRMLGLVGRLFTGRASLRGVQGPVGIVRFSGQAGEAGGVPAVVGLMSLISLSLGILNLLPIPVLDGGHIAMLAVEGGLRRDLSLRVKERLLQAGVVFLLLVFAVVMYNDIARIFTN
ncbi:MAG: RIP metalloprotease RseP [Acidobacteria bacterium RIFCSPHIGHO2_02_FULL_67_57]|nr:MAG: RIP metalloprotease RseP [Acidobacteria bacterium RIFCSPHIGHO2_02_FULL_67_57]